MQHRVSMDRSLTSLSCTSLARAQAPSRQIPRLRTMALRAALVARVSAVAAAEKYAVIAAGSSGFMNYRHQADACHAYQLMLQSGVPADNIILMMQDDVANSSENPFPGQLFNKPGENPPDVYKGCKVDYSGDIVTGKLFMDVLTGNTEGAKGKVLKSGASDTVFVNFVDHGGPGIVAFPNGPVLTVKELSQTLKTMQSKQMFKQMVFYMEACESGSMFPDLKADGAGKVKPIIKPITHSWLNNSFVVSGLTTEHHCNRPTARSSQLRPRTQTSLRGERIAVILPW